MAGDQYCVMPSSSKEGAEALKDIKVIAVVGLSPREERASYRVSKYMQEHGYRIIPVRPGVTEILGEKAYANLVEAGQHEAIDMVNIFRKPEAVPEIVDQAISLKAKVVWMQEGIGHPDAAEKAEAAGLKVVQNLCLMKVHQAL